MESAARRSLLRMSGSLLVGTFLAGCGGAGSSGDEAIPTEIATNEPPQTTTGMSTEAKTTSDRAATTSNEPTKVGTSTLREPKDSLKIWEVAANPEGQDSEHLNDETITLEAQGTDPINVAGYTIEYGTAQRYTFPKATSDLPEGTTISVHSGTGKNSVRASAPPHYDLFVGSETPLLKNDGGTLVLKDSSGTVVQKVTYPALNEGVPYGVPTPLATVTAQGNTTHPTSKSASTPPELTTKQLTSGTASQRETRAMCNGVESLTFHSVGTDLWDSSTVRVAFTIGPSAHIRLVVFENNTVLGTTQVKSPDEGVMEVDGQPIPLDTDLSGEHTIRVVAYPATAEDGQFNAQEMTPCRNQGKVQTGSATIDFGEFPEGTNTTS